MSLQAYLDSLNSGMDIVAGAQGMSARQLQALGAPEPEARELSALAATYFGPTAYTGKQAKARRTKHSLPVLKLIERYARRLKNQRASWDLRVRLCGMRASAGEIEKAARAAVKRSKPTAQPGVRIYRSPELWTLAITGPSSLIADLHAVIDARRPLESVREAFFKGTSRPAVRTNVLVPVDKYAEILRGEGDEVRLRMTNGAVLTGAEFLQRALHEHGLASLIHPFEGPVNLYRTQRLANEKQRLLAGAEHPTCAWPGCNLPADSAQVHHLTPWSRGGQTNMENLVTCCGYHNGINQDDPNAPPRRGRLARVDGKVCLQF